MYMDRPPARKKKTKPKQTDRAVLQGRKNALSRQALKKKAAEGPKKRMRRQGEPPNKGKAVGPRMDRRMKVAAARRKKGMGR